ncbi:ribonuclease H-like domain-containing protein [Tanacetum coccineum]
MGLARCNSVMLSWLLYCISQDLYRGQIYSKIAKAIWDELKETYDKHDGSVIFNLHYKIHSFTQAGIPLCEYYHTFNALWREFDILVNLPECSCDRAPALKNHNDLLKLIQFLMGLDDVYTPISSQILTIKPLPYAKSAFATLSRDESHRKSQHASSSKNSQAIFAARFNEWKNNKNNGHTIDKCFKLIGYPSGFKKRPGNEEAYDLLSSSVGNPADAQVNVAIAHPNGTIEKVKQIGSFQLSEKIVLKVVLVVLGYHVSLLSISKLSRDSKVVGDKKSIEERCEQIGGGNDTKVGGKRMTRVTRAALNATKAAVEEGIVPDELVKSPFRVLVKISKVLLYGEASTLV